MKGYSAFELFRNAVSGHRLWKPVWRTPEPKKSYDVVIIGAGGQGLATAYYLAANHGIRDVAVLEKGHIGGGNTGRNTQVTRSNYFWPQSAAFFDRSLKLYENLGRELNFNVMLSQRGVLTLAHSHHELEIMRRWANAIRINGIDSELLTPAQIQELVPLINLEARFPLHGGFIQRRAGISRPDAHPQAGQHFPEPPRRRNGKNGAPETNCLTRIWIVSLQTRFSAVTLPFSSSRAGTVIALG